MRHLTTMTMLLCILGATKLAEAVEYGQYDAPVDYVYFTWVYLQGTGTYVLETDNLTPGGDTVMYLVRGIPFQQVAKNDDYNGSVRSLIVFPKTALDPDGFYLLVVRSFNYFAHGACDVYVTPPGSPKQHLAHTEFGGYNLDTNLVAGDEVFAVPMSTDSLDTVLFAFNSTGDLIGFDDDGGVGRAARLDLSQPVAEIVASKYNTYPSTASARVVLNDSHNVDGDNDGLGPNLENALCTCDHHLQVTCWSGAVQRLCLVGSDGLYNMADTDGDGIEDSYEVVGKDGASSYTPPKHAGHLPMWGASPTHKDVFIEADWFDGTQAMLSNHANQIAAMFNGPGTAGVLKNPDGLDDVRVHLDIGRDDPAQGTVWGDWGGATVVPSGSYDPPAADRFDDVRRGIFHYVALDGGESAHQTGTGYVFHCNDDPLVCTHEFGHNLSLVHGGRASSTDQNGKPNYKSIMNYAFQTLPAFSRGTLPILNPTALSEADGLLMTSRADLDYLSVETTPLPCWALSVEPPPNDSNSYWAIDWNRDGLFGSGLVRAAPNYHAGSPAAPWSHCNPELGRYHWNFDGEFKHARGTWTVAGHQDTTPDITRVWGRLHVAYVDPSNNVKLLHTPDDFHTGCSGLLDTCAIWNQVQVDNKPAVGPALGVHHYGGNDLLVVVYGDSSGSWRYKVYDSQYGTVRNALVPMGQVPRGEPVLARYHDDLILVWVSGPTGEPGQVYANTMTPESTQFGPAVPQQADNNWGQGVRFANALASHPTGMRGLFTEKLSSTTAGFTWYEYDGDNHWLVAQGTGIEGTHEHALLVGLEYDHRMGLAFSTDLNLPGGGRWYLAYKEYYSPQWPEGKIRMAMTRGYGPGHEIWGSNTRYDNNYFVTDGGIALFRFVAGHVDTNVRMATVEHLEDFRLNFRPFADGIFDVALKDCDDFGVMERSLCGSLHGCTNPLCTHDGSSACLGAE